jgi:predicted dithiol-disulfide oxidoreductase (DUF899 family)
VHLNHRDVTMIATSHAPYSKLAAYKKRMGWDFKWVSSFETDFNFDYNVSFTPEELGKKEAFYNFTTQDPFSSQREGVSVFYKDTRGQVFRTYSAYARGIDMLNVAYHYLDLVPKGRDEASHLNLLTAFMPAKKILQTYEEAINEKYLWHEFGDLNLIL